MTPTYIGKTARIATVLHKQIPKLKEPTTPAVERRYLMTGPPGVGKSLLAEQIAAALTGEQYELIHNGQAVNVETVNGQSCTIDLVRQWTEAGRYGSLFGGTRVQIVDEIDAASPAACNELRTYLDKLPKGTIFLATTNKKVDELQEQLQSRFKTYYFEPVAAPEIKTWLVDKFKLAGEVAGSIAAGCKGNVRAAECDARSIIEAMA